ncbi:hypothetical protein Pan54_10520 [Rubinisphaera italica]|uniref:Uncharacterized protein n=2 Tax=Rubinisphaera italica TaxID=2527969 RepID=A0A5C5XC27_9PLAN|nr:hypothetical protein Pan54_10520 [Rubinisphaera italica]
MSAERDHKTKIINLLAVGQFPPDWDYLHARLQRLGLSLNEAQWVTGPKSALPFLRTEPWDCLLYAIEDSFDTAELHAIHIHLRAVRDMGILIPVILIAAELNDSLAEICQEWNCQFQEADFRKRSTGIGLVIFREIQANRTQEELRQAKTELRIRQQRSREEASLILSQQHRLLNDIVSVSAGSSNATVTSLTSTRVFDEAAKQKYDQILKNMVISGLSGSRQMLLSMLSEFEISGVSPGDILSLHLQALEKLIAGAGEKSTRHILQRADQLLVEVMVSLAETYRQHAA